MSDETPIAHTIAPDIAPVPAPGKNEEIRQLAIQLTSEYGAAPAHPHAHDYMLLTNLESYQTFLGKAYRDFHDATQEELSLSYASEWLLDNYYRVQEALREIKEDLPRGFYQRLPLIENGPLQGLPRMYAVACAALAFQSLRVDLPNLLLLLADFQQITPFTMGELWALPIFLRVGLVEALAHALAQMLSTGPVHEPLTLSKKAYPWEAAAVEAVGTPTNAVASAIIGLRTINEQSWKDFFESASLVEQTLRQDPTGVYPNMEFRTRDRYRKAVEQIAYAAQSPENDVAQAALQLAQAQSQAKLPEHPSADEAARQQRITHIGYYLIAQGRATLEAQLHAKPDGRTAFFRRVSQYATPFYLTVTILLSVLLVILGWRALPAALSWREQTVMLILLIIPAFTITTSLMNWWVTLFLPPTLLPKMDFKDGIPAEFRAVIAIPTLVTNHEEINSLSRQLEMHYLRNPDAGLRFALLADFQDAPTQTLPEDDALADHLQAAVNGLNEKYGRQANTRPFYAILRQRLWNPSEDCFMGWERKRGKLHEFNQFLLGALTADHFLRFAGDDQTLIGTPFVITLDTDTILPRDAARRMVGTLAHPLNRAIFQPDPHHPERSVLRSGYSVLQPRMEISPTSANRSWFTRIFAGDAGLDLYTLAVSDAYMDLFGEGIFVGKGIYDVAAFERSVSGHIPENSLLSHDLLEGVMGRAGLVTDITMIEDYPPTFFSHALRQHRWIRGDWQLLPWLLRPRAYSIHFSVIDRWKMVDNLRRSLLSPDLLILFVLGILYSPTLAWLWTLLLLLTLGFPMLQSLAHSSRQWMTGETPATAFHDTRWNFLRWGLAVAFLPYDAFISVDAVFVTLYRLIFTHDHFLQWTTAAHTARMLQQNHQTTVAWRRLIFSMLLGLGLILWCAWQYPPALWSAAPVLLLWMLSPQINLWLNRPVKQADVPLSDAEQAALRRITRSTWAFFERFAGPEDHWLPPDHYQEHPVGIVAHSTSPTNIGLLLTSTLAAYDLGYLDLLGLSARMSATFESLHQLERHNGHFLNWYDTSTLRPLQPRYISTVDSGNLAACLMIVSQASQEITRAPVMRWELWQGYLDSLSLLTEFLDQWMTFRAPAAAPLPAIKAQTTPPAAPLQMQSIQEQVQTVAAQIAAAREHPEQWMTLMRAVSGPFWQELSGCLAELITTPVSGSRLDLLHNLQEIASQIERQHAAMQRTVNELVPWIPLLESLPAALNQPPLQEAANTLRSTLPYTLSLDQIRSLIAPAGQQIAALRDQLTRQDGQAAEAHFAPADLTAVGAWLDQLQEVIEQAVSKAGALKIGFMQMAQESETLFRDMDFTFLYHPQRRVFHIGYNLDTTQLDTNFYDLLASEARLTSLIAIAKNEAPQQHWLQLGRPLTSINGQRVLLSWSATMFEYLMPPLFVRSYPGTLLDESAHGAVQYQMEYGHKNHVPWGISESGFYRFDASQNYQYQAFGAPGLGYKRGLGDELVIAPYASLMAVAYDPHAVVRNLNDLQKHGAVGIYGCYEAIDFTASRMLIGEKQALVREYMSHHHGMVMMAMTNFFHNNIMVRRMHADPRIQSVALLLQEQIPLTAPLQNPTDSGAKTVQSAGADKVELPPWNVPVQTPIPQMHLLSNGEYSVCISNAGSGYSAWQEIDLTRWQPDRALDSYGAWLYLQELPIDEAAPTSAAPWSATFQPIPGDPAENQVTYFAHMAVFQRKENGIVSTLEVTVPPEDPLEIRRIHLNNTSARPRRLRLTSYGEIILTSQATDARHPAFNKLFIESEWVEELNLQIFRRRQRSEEEKPVFAGHMLVLDPGDTQQMPTLEHESNRALFLGRYNTPRTPQAVMPEATLSGVSGATLDPIFALGQEVTLAAHATLQLTYITMAGSSRDEIIALAQRYHVWSATERAFQQADQEAQTWAAQQHVDSQGLRNLLQAFSSLLYPSPASRAAPEILATNRLGQSGLWRFGISGDFPILLVEVNDPRQLDLVREALQIHRYLHTRRFKADLVLLDAQHVDYGAELNGMLYRLVSRVNSEQWLNERGGVFILYADQMQPEELTLLKTSARLLLVGERGTLADQVPGYTHQVQHLPALMPIRNTIPLSSLNARRSASLPNYGQETGATIYPTAATFANGYGAFSKDGCEYIIDLQPGQHTPAPWTNVIGYPDFGFLVTEAGSQCTWATNSGENRLTPWSNDPVSDPSGEAIYVRDEESGAFWSPTPLPAGEPAPFRIHHAAGYTQFEHESHGLEQRLTLFASPEDPVKIIHLSVHNKLDHPRRVTVTQYVEWTLGTTHAANLPYILLEFEATTQSLLATNPYQTEFAERVAFLAANKPIHGFTADRTEFLGRNGSMRSPAALKRMGLETRLTPSEDPSAVLQLHLDLPANGTEEVYFILGEGHSRAQALALINKYQQPDAIGDAWQRTHTFWDALLNAVQVHTPADLGMERILNRWLLYQTLSCRVWGRTAFYQSSGAFGFRDQLQDVLALLAVDSSITRGQILNAAQHQFEEGDVLHWWHPPSGRGVRTRFSDDLLWLPYVTAQYVQATGEDALLDEQTQFRQGALLKPGEDERYDLYPISSQTASIYDHCARAIEKGMTHGSHGLPLFGTGDWNDGMNRLGEKGSGESVWLAWFLIDVLNRFAAVCDRRADSERAARYRQAAKDYAAAVERSAWDGAWYLRAYDDSGVPVGSSHNDECKIDSIAQSWAVLSAAGQPDHTAQAMQSVLDQLVRPADRLILLFTPPFDRTSRDPGYIKGYLPGIRENGGQYTHAATWVALAFARMGNSKQAMDLFSLLNPIYQADTRAKADVYRVEPFVICADIYSVPPYLRQGGWTWYTGSAAWMYRLGVEALLGINREGNTLLVNPVIPPEWDGFSVDYRYGQTTYHIEVKNPNHVTHSAPNPPIPLVDDGQPHAVEVTLKEK